MRKEAKKHGLQNWIEGPFIEEGTPVAVVDDTLTTGGSIIDAIQKARKAGGEVVAALVVIDREEGGREAVEVELGAAPLYALFEAVGAPWVASDRRPNPPVIGLGEHDGSEGQQRHLDWPRHMAVGDL